MNSVTKILNIIKNGNFCENEIEKVILKEIEIDRKLIIKKIEDTHCYGFDDVSELLEIKLREQWDSNYIRT